MPVRRALLGGVAALVFLASPVRSQTPTPADSASDELPRVFLDCQANGCDNDFLRTELTWLNFVRDRTLAMVHILATSQSTASGGTEVTIAFIGLGSNASRQDTLTAFSRQSDVHAERRQLVRRMISQGMMRFVANTPLASRLSVAYQAPAAGTTVSATRGARDRWNLWVFRIGGNTFFNGEETYKYYNYNGYVEASRITADLKINLGINANRSREEFSFDTSSTGTPAPLVSEVAVRRRSNVNALVARSLNDHWSLGVQANASSDLRTNLKLGTRIGPAIEYDVFPYSQSTRRQIVMRYSVGLKTLKYDSLTIYDKLDETLPDHRLVIASEATQPWGSVFGSVSASQYLTEPSKYRIDGFMYAEWRVTRGLRVNFDIGYTKFRDQINLKKGTATPQEVLLRLRQLQTGYYYYGSVGLSYTFGSVFSNVVNPRFTQNTGNFFF
jgi:hypothetical protein